MIAARTIACSALALTLFIMTQFPATEEASAVGAPAALPATPLFSASLAKSLTVPNLDEARASARKAKAKTAAKPAVKRAAKPAGKTRHFEVTAYTVGDDFTPSHGITASGERVKDGRTLACPKSLPFGTKVYLPALDRTYTCTDRGGMIKEGHLDIYMDSLKEALRFGRRQMKAVLNAA
ncbi:3D (Asp-Asp-Asp) domain-containing protein [Paenibacillus sp. UNC496MF]|uniref:3D domain-containing protein n=1 Tax=Paenibacillus sp. UNC496MF TaxID=1502753 RepID=UPI0008DF536B|nr:3D domain-containing protein [Paenibacillus sp. UNC496MF]SFI37821.1 3D (Asp-Asp-Asp) domain-containing protein [Paenibacillus sp. UNC496MF]